MKDTTIFRSGYVLLLGKPNAGKSTILNKLIGQRLTAVTPRPQTTRDTLLGIITTDAAQVIFMDTPGVHKPKNLLGEKMMRAVREALTDPDLVVAVLDAKAGMTGEDEILLEAVRGAKKKALCVINKVDLVLKQKILPLIVRLDAMKIFHEIIPTSATKGINMDVLMRKIVEYLPEGPKYFPDDQLTDRNERFVVTEIIREQALLVTHQEVPHGLAVKVEEFKERPKKKLLYIRATLYVEKESQKKIVIGRGGQMLKRIGQKSRAAIEVFAGKKVFLDLWVKVYENWRKDPNAVRSLTDTP